MKITFLWLQIGIVHYLNIYGIYNTHSLSLGFNILLNPLIIIIIIINTISVNHVQSTV